MNRPTLGQIVAFGEFWVELMAAVEREMAADAIPERDSHGNLLWLRADGTRR